MAGAVRIKGLREVDKAFRDMDKDAAKDLRKSLVEAARPVAETAQGLLSRYRGASVRTIRPRAVARGAFVTQGAKKTTGLRGDFGVLQMRQVMEPALEQNEAKVMEGAERAMDALSRRNGF